MYPLAIKSIISSALLFSSLSYADSYKYNRITTSQKQDYTEELTGSHPIKWFFWMTNSGRVFIADTRAGEDASSVTLWEHSLTNFTWTPISGGSVEKIFKSISISNDGRSITLSTNDSIDSSSSSSISIADNTPDTDTTRNSDAELAFIKSRAKSLIKNSSGYWEADFGDDIVMIYVPAGSFTMGNNKYSTVEAGGIYLPYPEHKVNLRGYWIAKTPVTIGQYRKFVTETKYSSEMLNSDNSGPFVYSIEEEGFVQKQGYYWDNSFKDLLAEYSTITINDKSPVNSVSWNDSIAYTNWLAKKTGLKFTLPSAAEWEYAARGSDGRVYPWGNDIPDGTKANYADETFKKYFPNLQQSHVHAGVSDGYAIIAPVDAYPAGKSPFGVLDMAGNLNDWIYDSSYDYTSDEVTDPIYTTEKSVKMQKGGSWAGSAGRFGQTPDEVKEGHNIRSDARQGDAPSSADDHLGFRVGISYTTRN